MTSYPTDPIIYEEPHLAQKHRTTLETGSAIARDIMERRGVRTVERGRGLPEGFSARQRRRGHGILFKIHRPNGETSWCYRPDAPDPKNPGCKYEQPSKHYGGPGNVLDVHPDSHHLIDDTDVPVIFVEGIKKADSIATALRAAGKRAVVVAISGVWNWISAGEPIPDMFDIPVEGRKAIILFDSDMLSNPNVQEAAGRLTEHLTGRGAAVWVTFLKDAPDGSKMGADDFFAGGGTVSELRLLMRRYDPADFARIHLSRDAKLRADVEDLWRRWWAFDWARVVGTGERPNSMRGHTCRDIVKVLVEAAAKHGKATAGGVRVSLGRRALALRASTSSRTVHKAIKHLEAEGWLRFEPPKSEDKPGSYVLLTDRANLHQVGTEYGQQGNVSQELQSLYRGGEDLRAPRLRWSAPTFERDGDRVVRGYIHRLGKINGSIVDLLCREGDIDINEAAEALNKRGRDLRRRNLPKLLEAEIIVVEGDVIRLATDWREALERERDLKGEIEATRRDEAKYQRQREAYRNRGKVEPDPHWANTGADGPVEDLQPADDPEPVEPEPTPGNDAAVRTVLDYVNRLGKIRFDLLEQIWLEDYGGDLAELRRAVDVSGVRKMRLPEYRNAVFLYPPLEDRGAA